MPEEVELSDEQLVRIDEVQNAVFEMCKVLTENKDLEPDIAFVGEIADYAAELLTSMGHRVRYPAILERDDGTEYVEDYWR